MNRVRVAFLTPEHPAVCASQGGGLASYLLRMTAALQEAGCDVEVFTTGERAQVIQHDGVRIEVCPPRDNRLLRLLSSHWRSRITLGGTLTQLQAALGLAHALAHREQSARFDLVQSSDWGLTGCFVKSVDHRTHIQRCSWSRELCRAASNQHKTFDFRVLSYLDRRCARRADVTYAPSQFIAEDLARRYAQPVHVVRPPAVSLDHSHHAPAQLAMSNDPLVQGAYLLHFGLMSPLKGTDLALAAFERAQTWVPDMRMVLVGREHQSGYVDGLLQAMNSGADHVTWRGPVNHADMSNITRCATATVLPSRADNLPNTVIESLTLGVPVIGTDGASIDELVTHEVTGLLVPLNDVDALANAMVRIWRQPSRVSQATLLRQPNWQAMTSEVAAANLLKLAGIEINSLRVAA